ncbi:butyrate kinase [Candidatus Fermentibacteria bacterium]|nr:butyrate kinase [Candidatus Fermentibacteria bacterium]
MGRLFLAINPGGTSTKIGVYEEDSPVFEESVRHLPEDLAKFHSTFDQIPMRRDLILSALAARGFDPSSMTAAVGRGGTFKPLAAGTYRVNDALLRDIAEGTTLQADHPSNLGAPLADAIARPLGRPAYFVDPVCVDEMIEEARLSGHPLLPRKSLSHALNIRMVAYKAAEKLGRPLGELNMVVLHLGSGVSVNAIRKGLMIDTNNANDGGPFSSQRTGSLPVTGLIELCTGGKYTAKDLSRMFLKEGGLFAYLGTDHVGEAVERAAAGDARADLVLRAMTYQFVKEGGAMAAALHGEVDCIVVTGGMAHNRWITDRIMEGLSFLGPVVVFPGEAELEALVRGVMRVLDGKEIERTYE